MVPSSLSPYSNHLFTVGALNNSWSNMYDYIPEGARVLDVGCSTGNFGEALEKLKRCTVIGVDINQADISEARSKISAAHVLDITSGIGSQDLGSFDVILLADVLEHLPDPRTVLRTLHSHLNSGGFVVYSIPHMGHWSVRLDLLEGRFPYTQLGLLDRTHLHFYDRYEIHDMFSAGGFVITAENPTVSGYPERWTGDRLNSIGLEPTPTFFAMLKNTEAHVYQYIGTAAPTSEAPPLIPREEVSPPDELLQRANSAILEVDRLETERAELYARVVDLRTRPLKGIAREIKRLVAHRKLR